MTTDQTTPEPEQDAETGGPVQAFVGWSLLDWTLRPGYRLQLRVAHWREPYWWHTDSSGLRRMDLMGVHYTSRDSGRFRLLAAILGPLILRFGWMT